tara:strand:- start:2880 stop:3833 length:954 start_codon:yes stop_codon:yes gene_type:complete
VDEWGQPGKTGHQIEPQIDTRQIRIFLSVLELGSVTLAANALGITQPAVSQVLRRLRDMTGDPLFVRSGSKLIPTIRAEEMLEPLRASLETIGSAFQSDQAFDPSRNDLVFRIASADCMEAFFLPRLISEIRKSAPNARIHLRSIVSGYDYATALEDGELDLVVANWPGPPGNLRTVRLMTDEMVCIFGPDHVLNGSAEVTLDEYMALEHVAPSPVSPREHGPVDGKLTELGLYRNIRVIVPEFNIVPYVLMSTDLVFTSSVSFARHYEMFLPIRSIPAPHEFGMMRFYLLWHERAQASPMNRWLRTEMIRIAADLQ